MPTALERQGDFTQSLIDKAVPVQIFDPLTGQSAANGDTIRQPFPGNVIPQNRFDPLSKVYLGYYPQPNHAPLPGSSHQSNFLGTSTNPTSDDRWTQRVRDPGAVGRQAQRSGEQPVRRSSPGRYGHGRPDDSIWPVVPVESPVA